MEAKKSVVLHGMWASPYARWVKIALKLKGIPYEYVEENLTTKSESLLSHNPINKKIPVLIHQGRPLVESFIILQYIDECWNNSSPILLPTDPHSRNMVRFWANFFINQLDESLRKVIGTLGTEEEQTSIEEAKTNLSILEENMKVIFPIEPPNYSGENMGMLDILLSTLPTVIKGIEEAFNFKLMDPRDYPLICSRMSSLSEVTAVKDTAPIQKRMVKFYQAYHRILTNLK